MRVPSEKFGLMAGLLTACGQTEPGPKGDAGPAGERGEVGPPGSKRTIAKRTAAAVPAGHKPRLRYAS